MARTPIPLRGLAEGELARAIRLDRTAPQQVRPRGALAELARRDIKAAVGPAMSLLADRRVAPDDRLEAARTLGHVPTAEARRSLVAALETDELVVRREAIRGLGRIGGPNELQTLDRLHRGAGGPLTETVRASQRLIAFREGIEGFRFARPGRREAPPALGEKTRPMTARPVGRDLLSTVAERMAYEAPAMKFDLDSALEVECLGNTLLIVHTEEATGRAGADRLARAPAIPMALMAYAHCSERHYLYGYVMTQPAGDRLEIFVTRLRGQPTHFGEARLDGGRTGFTLSALRTALAPPADLAGRYDTASGALTFERALVSTETAGMLALRQRPRADVEARPPVDRG